MEGREDEMETEGDEYKAELWICYKLLDECKIEAENSLEILEDERIKDSGLTEAMRTILIKRWTQIRLLIIEAFKNGIHEDTKEAFFRENMWVDVQGANTPENPIYQSYSFS